MTSKGTGSAHSYTLATNKTHNISGSIVHQQRLMAGGGGSGSSNMTNYFSGGALSHK
jgi:hypothetical protein